MSTDRTFVLPFLMRNFLSVDPVNVTPPFPLGVNVRSTSASVPIASIDASLLIRKPLAEVPVITVALVTSTFNTGLAVVVVSPT